MDAGMNNDVTKIGRFGCLIINLPHPPAGNRVRRRFHFTLHSVNIVALGIIKFSSQSHRITRRPIIDVRLHVLTIGSTTVDEILD
jgi:hypothetical protein